MKQVIPFSKDIPFKTKVSEITSISLEHNLRLEDNNVIGEMIVSGDYKISDLNPTVTNFNFKLPFEITLDQKYDSTRASIDIDDFYYEIIDEEKLRVNIDVLIAGIELKEELIKESFVAKEEVVLRDEIEEEPKDIKDEMLKEEVQEEVLREALKEEAVKEEFKKEELKEELKEEGLKVKEVESPTKGNGVREDNLEEEETAKIEVDGEKIRSLFDSFDDKDETFATYHVYIVRKEDTIDTVLNKYNISKDDLAIYNNLEEFKIGDKIIIPKIINE